MTDVDWYVLSINSQRYAKILDALIDLDVEAYYPRRTVWRKRRSGSRVPVQYPLIPSYVFVGCDLSVISARSILLIDGVHCFLQVGPHPSLCDVDQLNAIRMSEDAGDYDETSKRIEQILVGKIMTINHGAFKTFTGVISAVMGDSVEIDVKLFGKMNTVKIHIDNLDR